MNIGAFIEVSLNHFNQKQYDISLALACSAIDATVSKCGDNDDLHSYIKSKWKKSKKSPMDFLNELLTSLCCRKSNILNNFICFDDQKPDGSDKFKAKISILDFGEFFNNFIFSGKKSIL